MTSGGSPARRARVMRSCMMLKASTITVGMPGRRPPPTNWRLSDALRAEHGAQAARRFGGSIRRRLAASSTLSPAMVDAAAENVGVEIDRDDEPRAEHARGRHRHRIDQRAVDQPAAVERDRRKDPGQRIGRAHGVDQAAARQPDLVAGADLGRDGGEADRQRFDGGVAERARRACAASLPPPIRPPPDEADVEIAEDAAPGQAARPVRRARRAGRRRSSRRPPRRSRCRR